MADEAYRAVFLRIHPTGKMVLSLTTEADGNEGEYAQLVASELGVPALDVKVVPADESRFGTGHGFNTSPSDGVPDAIATATEQASAPRRSCWRARRWRPTRRAALGGRRLRRLRRRAHDRRPRPLRPRHRRAAARGRGRARRAGRLPVTQLGPENGTLTVRTGKGGAASKAGHNLVLEVQRWQGSLTPEQVTLTADARSLRVVSGSGGLSPLGDERRRGIAQTIDEEVLEGGNIAYRSSAVTAREDGYDVDGELDLLGVSRPLSFALELDGDHLTGRAQVKQTDCKHQAVLGAVRDPQGRRRRRGHDRRHPPERHCRWLNSTTRSQTGKHADVQLGRGPGPRPHHPVRRGRQGARARDRPSWPRPRSRSRWARCR